MSPAQKNRPLLVLVDGSSYLFRAYHALPPLMTSDGLATGAIKGVVNMLNSLIKKYPTDNFGVVFDAKGPTFRHEMYSEYKANRPPMPDELRQQIQPLHDVIDALGLPRIVVDGVEADDVIGTLAEQAVVKGYDVLISTGDKDLAQLVNPHVTLIDTMKNQVLDPEGVTEKFGIPPELIIDFLALMGDSSDNIPGMPGVGQKTALGLLQGLGNINEIYANLDKIAALSFRGAKTLAPKLAENREIVDLSYQLATIKLDCDLPLSVEEIIATPADNQALLTLYQRLEFRSWQQKLESATHTAAPEEQHETEYAIITEQADFLAWLDKLKAAPVFAFDTETTSLEYMQAKIVGLSFAVEPFKAAYVPLAHHDMSYPQQLDKNWVLAQLKPLLENPQHIKIGQHLKYDHHILMHEGINLVGIEDTMLQSYCLNSTATRHDMDSLARYYLNQSTTSFTDIAGKGAKQLRFDDIAIDIAGPYAAEDADITLRLYRCLQEKLAKEQALATVYQELERPLSGVLAKMEYTGVQIDKGLLAQQSEELAKELLRLEEQVYALAGEPFNLSSPKQLGVILFEKLGLPVIKKTKQGVPSTAEPILAELAESYDLPQLILSYRSLAKLKSTYTDKLPHAMDAHTGRIHTSYHQTGTATGRLSSSNPNLQNIPIRSAEGRRIRQAFTAPEDYTIVAADYSQVELRIMAHLSNDEALLHAFNAGLDIHRATAAEVMNKPLDAVTTEERRQAKAVNFGLIYGMKAFGLAKQLGISRSEAKQYIDRYFERYPGVAEFMDTIKVAAKQHGYVETLTGRRLYLPAINSSNGMLKQAAERLAINAPMQGTAADIIKAAMIAVDKWLQAEEHSQETGKAPIRMIMQVHDELVFEVPTAQLDEACATIKDLMENAYALSVPLFKEPLKVPLIVDIGTGKNWDDAH